MEFCTENSCISIKDAFGIFFVSNALLTFSPPVTIIFTFLLFTTENIHNDTHIIHCYLFVPDKCVPALPFLSLTISSLHFIWQTVGIIQGIGEAYLRKNISTDTRFLLSGWCMWHFTTGTGQDVTNITQVLQTN